MKELIFETAPPRDGEGIIDGPCKLNEKIQWPHGEDASPLFHLLSVPLVWLTPDKDTNASNGRWVSVFVSYDKAGYSHYGKMSSDTPDHADAAVILHDMTGPKRSLHPNQGAASKNIALAPAREGDDNVASYVDSVPSWVQDPIELNGFSWVLSIYGPDMDASLVENRGIFSDGVGYVFLRANFDPDSFGTVGKFFLQL